MTLFRAVAVATVAALGLILWLGGAPERRYVNALCQYRLIHQAPGEMGIVSVGGSRILTALDAHHLNEMLDASGVPHRPAYNLAHSHWTLAKEYTLIRDLLERGWAPRSILVMLDPRDDHHGAIHPEFAEIARLSDIPLSMRALWSEDPWAAIAGAGQILRHHLRFWERLKLPKGLDPEARVDNCHRGDYRLTLDQLERTGELAARAAETGPLDWDFDAPDEAFTRTYVDAFTELAAAYGTEVIFVHMTNAGTAPPQRAAAAAFRRTTGAHLIVQPPEIASEMDRIGRRDISHINALGRSTYLPWLIGEIRGACRSEAGCL